MTRIALMPSSYPPSLGGVEELTRHLALALVQAGEQVEVWTGQPDDAGPETAEVRDGLVVRRLPMPLPATNWSAIRRSATTGTRTLSSLRSAVAAFRPDILHVQCFGPNGAYATVLSRWTGLPLVISLQGETLMDDTDIFEVSRSLRSALRRGLRAAAAVTACSAFTLADAELRFGLAPGRGQVIPNGVDSGLAATELAAVEPAVDNLAADNPSNQPAVDNLAADNPAAERPYVLAVGRLVDKKGFDLLLEAYARIRPSRRPFDLVVGGTGPALDNLVTRSAELGLTGQVRFVGRLSRDEVATWMVGAEIFVLPSRLEPFGIVILEAWRAGTAVVATNRGGPPEFVGDGQDGILVDPFDAASLAAALEELMADDPRRIALAAAGRARVGSFSWTLVAEQYRRLYASVTRDRVDSEHLHRDLESAGRREVAR